MAWTDIRDGWPAIFTAAVEAGRTIRGQVPAVLQPPLAPDMLLQARVPSAH